MSIYSTLIRETIKLTVRYHTGKYAKFSCSCSCIYNSQLLYLITQLIILHWLLTGSKALSIVRGSAFPSEPQGLRYLTYLWHIHLDAAQ